MLGLPPQKSKMVINKSLAFLRNKDVKQRFSHTLHSLAKRLSENTEKIDFGARRKVLEHLTDISHTRWVEICRAAKIKLGHLGGRSRYAATWLWANLTSGDWTLAPGLHGKKASSVRQVYQFVSQNIISDCRVALINYGMSLLSVLERQ